MHYLYGFTTAAAWTLCLIVVYVVHSDTVPPPPLRKTLAWMLALFYSIVVHTTAFMLTASWFITSLRMVTILFLLLHYNHASVLGTFPGMVIVASLTVCELQFIPLGSALALVLWQPHLPVRHVGVMLFMGSVASLLLWGMPHWNLLLDSVLLGQVSLMVTIPEVKEVHHVENQYVSVPVEGSSSSSSDSEDYVTITVD